MNCELFYVHFKDFAHAKYDEMIAKEYKTFPVERTKRYGEMTMVKDAIK